MVSEQNTLVLPLQIVHTTFDALAATVERIGADQSYHFARFSRLFRLTLLFITPYTPFGPFTTP